MHPVYAIGGVLSQLNSDQRHSESDENSSKSSDVGQWHPVAFFSRKMIPAETRYDTHDQELQAIVEAFKNWRHYLEGCKYEVLVLTDHNNLCRFMDTKSLGSKQSRWAQDLSRYHFRIDYRQRKANAAADSLSRFPQRSQALQDAFRAENSQILHRLQALLTKASLVGLSLSALAANSSEAPAASFSLLHQVLIYGTYVLLRLYRFWEGLHGELAKERPYQQASIERLRLRLSELQAEDQRAWEIRKQGLKNGWEDIKVVLHRESLLYLPEIIRTEIISRHHDDPLVGHFGIEKTRELVAQKYYWQSLRHNVEAYVKACNVCLASKAVLHKPYGDLQSLLVPTHC